jgi:hypothetical protein
VHEENIIKASHVVVLILVLAADDVPIVLEGSTGPLLFL